MTTTTIVEARRRAYLAAFERRYRMYLTELFFPVVDGVHQPLFQHVLNERQVYLRLREVRRRLELVQAGEAQHDYETAALAANKDGAMDVFDRLHGKYASSMTGGA